MTTIRRVLRPHLLLEVILVIAILVAYLLVVTRGEILTSLAVSHTAAPSPSARH